MLRRARATGAAGQPGRPGGSRTGSQAEGNAMTTVAFLGTGTMGAPMARNLLAHGFAVRAWNRTRARAEGLAADGATVVDTPAEAARGADVLVTMLLDAEATTEAGGQAAAEMPPGAPWLQMATIGLGGLARVAELAADLTLVDAPVLGTRAPAEQGTLTVLAAGPEHVRDRARPVFDAVGGRTLWLGEDAARGDGTRVKLAANAWVLSLTNAVGESIALAEALGVDPRLFLDAIAGGAVDSPYAHLKGEAILSGELAPAFTVDGAHKDAGLIAEAAGELRLDLAAAARARFARASRAGHGGEDMAAAYYASFTEEP
ncbi:NAD(P)-dependent oxidoreductase [Saccharopolyspora sp. MS10]|uniref:NAD(P)-dependent oxidoreductase n=1 Tax=Saccharopolyspora sp. MS10 TaxID=3385973 RepID=UPI0039A052DA